MTTLRYTPERRRTKGFTLVELLVVIAIIGVLVGMLMPAINAAREAARRASCSNNSRQLGVSVLNFESTRQVFPASGWTEKGPGNPYGKYVGWRSMVLPFLEEQALHDLYDIRHQWWEAANLDAASIRINVFLCPSAPARRPVTSAVAHRDRPAMEFAQPVAPTDYEAIMGVQPSAINSHLDLDAYHAGNRFAIMHRNSRVKTKHVRDGLSRTIMIVECGGRPGVYRDRRLRADLRNDQGIGWIDSEGAFSLDGANADGSLEGEGKDAGCTVAMNRRNDNEPYSFHSSGGLCVFGDGHVEFISEDVSLLTMAALCTRGGHERSQTYER